MKTIFFMISLLTGVQVLAANPPDLKKLNYTAKRIESFQGIAIEFTPPANHHFNMEAPSAVTQDVGLKSEKGQLDKKPEFIRVSWPTENSQCDISAQLYVCDEKNSYCVPIRKKFSCASLTMNKEVQGNTEKPQKQDEVVRAETKNESLFIVNEPQKAIEKAKAEKKLLLIDFFGIWCPPCNILDETVFSKKEFSQFQKDYVFLKLDADDEVSWELKSKYNVKGYPTIMIVNNELDEVLRIVGSRKPNAFYSMMRKALKFKSETLAARKAKADSGKNPDAAYELAEMYLDQEDYPQAVRYFTLSLKKSNWTETQKNKMLSANLGLVKDPRTQAQLLESALVTFPYGYEAYERANKLAELAEELKDESLKNRALNAQFKNAEHLLKNPKLYQDAELTEADLHMILADVYENLKDEAKMKDSYYKAFQAYTKQIKAAGLDESKERGHNLDRAYAVYKSGRIGEANKIWEQMQALHPEEFTYYFAQANALKTLGQSEAALAKAEKAMQYSYGDNKLRAVHLVAEIRAALGKKREATSLIDETLKSAKAPEDEQVRTHRYLGKLKTLKEKIQK